MINPSETAAEAMTAGIRKLYARAALDLIDPDITFGMPTSSGHIPHSRMAQLQNKAVDGAPKYATLEVDRWALDGTWDLFPDNPADATGELAYIGNTVCDETGAFAEPYPWVRLNFSNVQILQAAAIAFSDLPIDGHASDFIFDVLSGSDVVYSEAVTDNTETLRYFGGFTVHYPTAIRLTFTKWSIPYRRPRLLEIIPGVFENWDNSIIYSLDITQETDFSCMTAPYGTAYLEIWNQNRRFDPRNKSGLFRSIEERQSIPLHMGVRLPDGTREFMPCGVYYQQNGGWETAYNGLTMKFKLVDIVGLLQERKYDPPLTLPPTLGGWAASLVSQLGTNFRNRYIVDAGVVNTALTCTKPDVETITCGDLLRFICMATGTYFRADTQTGYLRIEPPPRTGGTALTLDNMNAYPIAKANKDIASITFQINDAQKTQYLIGGTNTASSDTLSIANPFIKTTQQADAVARQIIRYYGGQRYEIRGRGDLRSELGDLDAAEIGLGDSTGGRRYRQQFKLDSGIMKNVPSFLLQATGEAVYSDTVVITEGGQWTAPIGVTTLRITLIGGGSGGYSGEHGGFFNAGASGKGGKGGRVYSETIQINSGQTFNISIGAGGGPGGYAEPGQPGGNTTFGVYSSQYGSVFTGWVDLMTGGAYCLTGPEGFTGPVGALAPIPGYDAKENTGNGGGGGFGGAAAVLKHLGMGRYEVVIGSGPGGPGGYGGSGLVIVSYDK